MMSTPATDSSPSPAASQRRRSRKAPQPRCLRRHPNAIYDPSYYYLSVRRSVRESGAVPPSRKTCSDNLWADYMDMKRNIRQQRAEREAAARETERRVAVWRGIERQMLQMEISAAVDAAAAEQQADADEEAANCQAAAEALAVEQLSVLAEQQAAAVAAAAEGQAAVERQIEDELQVQAELEEELERERYLVLLVPHSEGNDRARG